MKNQRENKIICVRWDKGLFFYNLEMANWCRNRKKPEEILFSRHIPIGRGKLINGDNKSGNAGVALPSVISFVFNIMSVDTRIFI